MTSSQTTERRKSKRFDLALPIHVVRLSDQSVSFVSRTRDVSSAGAYFVIEGEVSTGTAIEFFVTLHGGISAVQKVRLHCLGRITRAEKLSQGGRIGIATTIDRYQFIRDSRN